MVKIKRERQGLKEAQVKKRVTEPIIFQETRLDLTRQEEQIENKNTMNTRRAFWLVAVISIVFFLFALSYLFLRATVTVNPKIQDVILNESLSATRDGNEDILPFDLVVISGEENKIIQATGEKDFSQRAEGVVLIYNTFSSVSQLLSIDTRLEGSNGKIYKTKTRITVPGMKEGVPGSVEVGIYGAEAGPEYNSVPLDFKIFGFRGTPKYEKFYARSRGAITGGLKGKFSVIADNEKVNVTNELKNVLQAKLFKKVTDQIPSGFILFKDAVFLSVDDQGIDVSPSLDNTVPIKLKGTLYGFLFDEQKLSKKIAEDNIKKYDGSEVFIPNIRNLTFSFPERDNISFGDVKNINFNLSGAIKIVWKLDIDKLVADLLGKSKKDFNQILFQYPNIDSADLTINPFWKRSFPDKTKDIKIIVNYPK